MISNYFEEIAKNNRDMHFLKIGIEELSNVAQEVEVCK
jgi:hypothetical protein